jgi:hypothetical protein
LTTEKTEEEVALVIEEQDLERREVLLAEQVECD